MADKRVRAKAVTESNFYDVFGDWPAGEQANVLKVLEQIHRQTLRVEAKKPKAGPVVTTPIYPCPICGARDLNTHNAGCLNRPAPVQESLITEAPVCVKCGAAHGPEQPSCLAAK